MIDVVVLLIIVLTAVGMLIFEGIGFMYFLFLKMMKAKINNIDIIILDITKNGWLVDVKKGRVIFDDKKGYRLVTCGLMPNSITDNLGYNITRKDMFPSKRGPRRLATIVVRKDGLTQPVNMILKTKSLTPEEKELLQKVKKAFGTRIAQTELEDCEKIPQSLSITPVLSECVSFVIQSVKDAHTIFTDKKKEALQKTIIIASLVFAGIVIIGGFIFIILLATKAPGAISAMKPPIVQYIITNASSMPPG